MGLAGEQGRAQLAGRVGRAAGERAEGDALQAEHQAHDPRQRPRRTVVLDPAHHPDDHGENGGLGERDHRDAPAEAEIGLDDRPAGRVGRHRGAPDQAGRGRRGDRAGDLGDQVGQDPAAGGVPAHEQREGDRRVHVGARPAARPGHDETHDDQADQHRHDGAAQPQLGAGGASAGGAQPPAHQGEDGEEERRRQAELARRHGDVHALRPERMGPRDLDGPCGDQNHVFSLGAGAGQDQG
nr:hypothetical protein [Actinoplanes toevensis]